MARAEHALWTEIDGEPWIDNPRRRRRRKGGHKRRHRRARTNAPRRRHKRKRGRRRMPAGLRRFLEMKNARKGRRSMARRHHRRHRRRGFRHNPPGGGFARGMMGRVMEGVKGGLGVIAGKAAVRAIPTMARLPRTGPVGIIVQGLVGVIAAPFVDRFLRGWGKPFLYGAFAAPLESVIVGLNLPIIGPALSSYPDELSAIPATVTSLGDAGAPPGFMIDDEEQALVQ